MDVNFVLKLIKEGENERVEFKKKYVHEIGEEIVALANAEGGYILIGVDDEGNIVGCDERKVTQRITNILLEISPKINIKLHTVDIGGKKIVVIEVPKSKEIVTIGDVAYIRIGKGKRVLSLQEIFWRKVENLEVFWDSLPSPATLEFLDERKFKEYLKIRKEKRNMPFVGELMEDLKKSKAIVKRGEKFYLTNAALLFFSKNPQEFYPHASIRYAEFDENLEIIHEKTFRGTVVEMINNSFDYVISRLGKMSYRITAEREYILEYPERAIREAIINAFAHRNYTIYSDIRIMKFSDKLVIRSPGSLPPGVSLENPEHIPRNPLICQYLFDFGFIERYGIGINLIRKECLEHPFVEVEFKDNPYFFEVIFRKTYKGLDELDRLILRYYNQGLSIREIARRVGKSKSTVYKRLKKLLKEGLSTTVHRKR